MSDRPLLIDVSEGVATLTLNRAEVLNALNGELRALLVQSLAEVDANEDVRAIILTGKGRAFCAGLDVKELEGSGRNVGDNVEGGDIGAALSALETPVIAAINGLAVTGGFEITLACDIVLAARSAWFQDTHAKIGLLPGWGLSQRLSRTIGTYRAKEISLTARRITAQEAMAFGFVNRVVADEDLAKEARDLALSIAQWRGGHIRKIKSLIDQGYSLPFGEALDFEIRQAAALNRQVNLGEKSKDIRD